MRAISIAALLCACVAAASVRAAGAQERKLIYSALEDFRPTPVPAANEQMVRRDVLPVVRRLWGRVDGCREEFRVVGAAYGAFTEAGMSQRAILYRFCETGHDFARGGIAITQAGRVVAHVTIENAEPDGIRRLPDIDRNGVAELLLVDDATHQGESSVVVSIVQLTPRGVQAMGSTGVYHANLGTRSGDRSEVASILHAIAGRRPRFELETYAHPEGSRARWIGTEKLHPVTLQPDRAAYRRIR
ncbi:MAG TPA: hypothetical protein VFJ82_06195 [Longimicrobium sp.]|nr:hypothetical protein [Longimicrobium sp.]